MSLRAGILLGTGTALAAGVALEYATRPPAGVDHAAADTWQRQFEAHMAKHDVADAVRTATIDGEIGAYTREHVPPPGVVGERRGGAFEVSRDPDAERGVAPLLTLVSVLGGMATAYLASKHVRSAPDMQRFVGAAGSAWLALPIAVIGSTPAFLGAAALGPDRRPA